MIAVLEIYDEAPGVAPTPAGHLRLVQDAPVTARTLIEARVEQEIAAHVASGDGLRRSPWLHPVDGAPSLAEEQARAVAAFEAGQFLLLVDGRQLERPDDAVGLDDQRLTVTFLRLVPLVGG